MTTQSQANVPDSVQPTTKTIIDIFKQQATLTPNRPLYTFVDQAGQDQETLTAQQLAQAADAIAGFLTQRCGLSRGDRALLVYPPSLDFVKALMGCLTAGVIPVPVVPPNPANLERSLELLAILAEQADTNVMLTNQQYNRFRKLSSAKQFLTRSNRRWPDLTWQRTDTVKPGSYVPPTLNPTIAPDDLAFLQYTSGSTSLPKGVMVTHANLVHQLSNNAQDFTMRPDARGVLWLPHFHDLCLVAGILGAVYGNGHLTLLSPLSFLQRPAVWFEVMSRVRATHTAAPNFAYALAVRKTTPTERSQWDLSSLEVMMNGAEPIRHATVEKFFTTFAETGLARKAFSPIYGLAEHTLGVSVQGKASVRVDRHALEAEGIVHAVASDHEQSAHTLFGCGPPSAGVQVRIVDPDSHTRCAPGEVGEIWVDSPSKAAGYFGRAQESQETFQATIVGENDATEYLRTGDLGFLHAGELFITGRHKDLIIIRGHNYYPHDIELTVEQSHEALCSGCGAAFSIDVAGEERLVVLQEIQRNLERNLDTESVIQTIRRTVAHDHKLQVYAVVLLAPSSILKTSSGKIQRSACRAAFLAGALKTIAHWQAEEAEFAAAPSVDLPDQTTESIARWMVEWLSQALTLPAQAIETQQPFGEFGLDSIQAVEFSQDLSQWLDLAQPLEPTVAWNYPTIDALSQHLASMVAGETPPAGQHRRPAPDEPSGPNSRATLPEGTLHRNGISSPEQTAEMAETINKLSEAELAQLLASEIASDIPRRSA